MVRKYCLVSRVNGMESLLIALSIVLIHSLLPSTISGVHLDCFGLLAFLAQQVVGSGLLCLALGSSSFRLRLLRLLCFLSGVLFGGLSRFVGYNLFRFVDRGFVIKKTNFCWFFVKPRKFFSGSSKMRTVNSCGFPARTHPFSIAFAIEDASSTIDFILKTFVLRSNYGLNGRCDDIVAPIFCAWFFSGNFVYNKNSIETGHLLG